MKTGRIEEWNRIYAGRPLYQIDLCLPPEPFLGYHDAPLVVLAANPGLAPGDYQAYQRVGAADRLAEVARDGGGSFRWLADDVEDTPGGRWWRRCLSGLAGEGLGFAELAGRILAVEFRGYHASKWAPLPVTIPSQWFGFSLVKQAMDRGAVIVVTRAYREWRMAVPGLASYASLVHTTQVRTASIGPGNIEPDGFNLVSAALRGGRSLPDACQAVYGPTVPRGSHDLASDAVSADKHAPSHETASHCLGSAQIYRSPGENPQAAALRSSRFSSSDKSQVPEDSVR